MNRSLGPLIRKTSRILILGSFPGPESLKKREYYAHPQNRFWGILANVLKPERAPESYRNKKALLARSGIGLWDMVASCERRGAEDTNIKKETPNDIAGLLSKYPNVKAIYFNGKKAERLFKKYCKISIRTECLPSTSPANASIPDSRKLNAWKKIAIKIDKKTVESYNLTIWKKKY